MIASSFPLLDVLSYGRTAPSEGAAPSADGAFAAALAAAVGGATPAATDAPAEGTPLTDAEGSDAVVTDAEPTEVGMPDAAAMAALPPGYAAFFLSAPHPVPVTPSAPARADGPAPLPTIDAGAPLPGMLALGNSPDGSPLPTEAQPSDAGATPPNGATPVAAPGAGEVFATVLSTGRTSPSPDGLSRVDEALAPGASRGEKGSPPAPPSLSQEALLHEAPRPTSAADSAPTLSAPAVSTPAANTPAVTAPASPAAAPVRSGATLVADPATPPAPPAAPPAALSTDSAPPAAPPSSPAVSRAARPAGSPIKAVTEGPVLGQPPALPAFDVPEPAAGIQPEAVRRVQFAAMPADAPASASSTADLPSAVPPAVLSALQAAFPAAVTASAVTASSVTDGPATANSVTDSLAPADPATEHPADAPASLPAAPAPGALPDAGMAAVAQAGATLIAEGAPAEAPTADAEPAPAEASAEPAALAPESRPAPAHGQQSNGQQSNGQQNHGQPSDNTSAPADLSSRPVATRDSLAPTDTAASTDAPAPAGGTAPAPDTADAAPLPTDDAPEAADPTVAAPAAPTTDGPQTTASPVEKGAPTPAPLPLGWIDRLPRLGPVTTPGFDADAWQAVEVRLEEGDGTVEIRARRHEEGVAVTLRFSDPAVAQRAEREADTLRARLESTYGTAVDLSFTGGSAADRGADDRQTSPPAASLTTTSASPDTAPKNPAARPLGRREWIG